MEIVRTTGLGGRRGRARIDELERRGATLDARVLPTAERIVNAVRKDGDKALRAWSAKLDGLDTKSPLLIDPARMQAALAEIPTAMRNALEQAAANIRAFAEKQMPQSWTFEPGDGLSVGQLVRPLDSVGCYVPSGRHPLPSTLLMTAIPAQVAGVRRIVAISPRPATEVLAAAAMLGITEFYQMGGAQGVAALAYGTASVPRVDKIVGPGNAYVTAAKKLVAFDASIDMLAGPTEIIVTSERGKANEIAADLVAQSEHDPDAVAIFITTQADLARRVAAEAKQQARSNPIAALSLDRNGVAIIASSIEEAREITNRLAGEHLTVDTAEDVAWVRHAGSVFIGRWSPQPMGDYVSGPNHTLPTGGVARLRGGLSVYDYLKLITVQQYTPQGLATYGPAAIRVAEAEGLTGHAEAIRSRGVVA
ncbi:histidinol dehydrogenase [Acidipila sp. EB88]|uniref:histidinol dehydrogenase n=1 Tax=Acidipila sp. EB88 TaxID=2305226 RepID=UPI000F5EE7D9|nr:histidinol dehydrogenase [Acidipila sp. EB88]RRA47850.1 histidinol dehydrogenase [Acidipila sp. EB88]